MDLITRLREALAGRYDVEREIGAGGMATVFLAEDVRHHRKVAIKVLRDDVAASVGEARFLREIEIAAKLQHPHILPLLDSGNANGLLFYVMPFVEGESLRERLTRERELPISDAVRYTAQVVDALAYAHAHGVIHRDIKPENVMVTGRHSVVTDFGVAKAVTEARTDLTGAMTSVGVALGTPAYMSPEQAAADPHVDHRADIYSVGAMAYELLAGQPPFVGRSPQQLLVAHVTQSAEPLSKHRPQVWPELDEAIMRCLEKRPADRWQSADDLLAVLEPMATPGAGSTPTSHRPVTQRRARRTKWVAAAAALVLAVLAGVVWSLAQNKPAPLIIGLTDQLTTDPDLELQPAVSPDGKFIAYAMGRSNRTRIFIRPVAGGRTFALSDDTTAMEYQPQWSPDGQHLLYLSAGGASIAPALGGETRAAVPPSTVSIVTSATWSPDGTEIAFVRGESLYRMPVAGGTSNLVGTVIGDELHSCVWSPNAKWIACVAANFGAVQPSRQFGNRAPSAILLFPASGGDPATIVERSEMNLSPVWASDSRTLYFLSSRDGPRDIYALALSSSGEPRGAPSRLTTGLNAMAFSLSRDGRRLAYASYSTRANIWAVPIPTGAPIGIERAVAWTTGSQTVESMIVSPDGKWIVYDSDIRGNSDIFRIAASGGASEQLTSEPWDEFAGALSPDGRHVAYHSFRSGSRDIEVKPLDGGPVELVTATPAQESYPDWSPDGQSIAFNDQALPRHVFVTTRSAAGQWTRPRSFGPGVGLLWMPDGASLLMVAPPPEHSARGGVPEISIASLRDGTKRVVFSASDVMPRVATRPRPSPDGRTTYLKSHDAEGRASFWAVPVAGGPARLLVRLTDLSRPSSRADFAVDSERLYFTLDERHSDVFVAEVNR